MRRDSRTGVFAVQNEFLVGCFPAVSIFCGSTEFKRSIYVQSESVVRHDEFLVQNFTDVNSTRGVSTCLTWEMKSSQNFYKPLVLTSETINWNAVKGHFGVRLVRLISVRFQTFNFSSRNLFDFTDHWTFRRLGKKKFIGNCRVLSHTMFTSRKEKISISISKV